MLLNEFLNAGINSVLGIDFMDDFSALEISQDYYKIYDLNRIGDLKLNCRYDLVACLEVAEHLKTEVADDLVKFLTTASDLVWFSAAIPYQRGEGHINEQWTEYWEEKFSDMRFVRIDWFRAKTWNMRELMGYYRQNMLMYVNEDKLSEWPSLHDFYLTKNDLLPKHMVHPTVYRFSANNL